MTDLFFLSLGGFGVGVAMANMWHLHTRRPGAPLPRKTRLLRIDKDGPGRTPWRALVETPQGRHVYYGDEYFWFDSDDGVQPSIELGLLLDSRRRAIAAGILDNDLKPLHNG